MRTIAIATLLAAAVVTLGAPASSARSLDGTVKVGGVFLDQTGDRTAVQEISDVYDGFALSQIRLDGSLDPRQYVMLDLRDINLDSRQGDLLYRMPGTLKLTAGYVQHRRIFSPDGAVNSDRKDWRAGAQFTPHKWLALSGSFNAYNRGGDRLAFPLGTAGTLGTRYDDALKSGRLAADVHRGRNGGGISYSISSYSNDLETAAKRTGQVVAARFYTPFLFYDKWTHLFRGAYGIQKLSDSGIDHTLSLFEYTTVIEPTGAFQLRYNFNASRVDDEATRLKTDRFQNDVDATYSYKYGRVRGGYGYETNDDRSLTYYHSWRAGTDFNQGKRLRATVDYAGRVKKDQEQLTLLQDIESYRVRGKLQVQPVEGVAVGGGYSKRQREFTGIGVKVDGDVANGFGRYTREGWGALFADYSYSNDKYVDRVGRFDTQSYIVTGRVEIGRIKNLQLAGGVTYLKFTKDLDIEKSLVFVEGAYRLLDDYRLEVKYNVYNYDDYVLLDRYYTANVVRVNLAYDLHLR